MTQEQIDKECDALIKAHLSICMQYELTESEFEEHRNVNDEGYSFGYELSLKQAILHQTGIVDTLEKLMDDLNLFDKEDMAVICHKLTEAKQILETLKLRVK